VELCEQTDGQTDSIAISIAASNMLRRVTEGEMEGKKTRGRRGTMIVDDEERQPKVWTTERNGTKQRRLASLEEY